jgi:hypothetical protein
MQSEGNRAICPPDEDAGARPVEAEVTGEIINDTFEQAYRDMPLLCATSY